LCCGLYLFFVFFFVFFPIFFSREGHREARRPGRSEWPQRGSPIAKQPGVDAQRRYGQQAERSPDREHELSLPIDGAFPEHPV
jgi:hypothetical protein